MKFFSFLTISLFFITSCKKTPIDYREKYLGDYTFLYSYSSWSINNSESTTEEKESTGEVYYNGDAKDSLIHIKVAENLIFECTIDEDGNIKNCGGNGVFENNSKLTFDYKSISCPGNGNGGGIEYSIQGNKK